MEVSGRDQADNDDVNKIQCDPCASENETVPGEFYCTDCLEYLCNNCATAHRKSKISKHHNLLGRDEMPKKNLTTVGVQQKFCSKHTNKQIIFVKNMNSCTVQIVLSKNIGNVKFCV